jgi:imidazoleglycerol-phosphate dehydratase
MKMARTAKLARTTLETTVNLELNLDGSGRAALQSGIAFLDHMLTLWCRHGFFDLDLEASGDLAVEPHHLVEDIGLCLGRAFQEALGDKAGIKRYGFSAVPMDDALVMAAVDLSGRPFLHYAMPLPPGPVGTLDPELFLEFWQAFVNEGRLNLHLKMEHGRNKHHLVEASFKAAARALNEAASKPGGYDGVLSTKGILE